jgi:galactoside O-acetyltransferase
MEEGNMDSFYNPDELMYFQFLSLGKNVKISRKASIYGAKSISLGSDVRIDDFCVISGKVTIGDYTHIAVGCVLFAGDAGIELKDFSACSSRIMIYAISDDYSGESLVGPTVPDQYRNLKIGKVTLEKFATVGSGCTIFPGVTLHEGCAVGAMSLVIRDLPSWKFCAGIPAKEIQDRSRRMVELADDLLKSSRTPR